MVDLNFASLTNEQIIEQLSRMIEEGEASLVREIGTSFSIRVGNEVIGQVNVDTMLNRGVVSVGGRELGKFIPEH